MQIELPTLNSNQKRVVQTKILKSHLNKDYVENTNTLNQAKVSRANEIILDDIHNILEFFDYKVKSNGKKILGGCPVHGGDGTKNPFNMFLIGDSYVGNWKCRSHGCENVFKPSALGLLRGLISRYKYGWKIQGDPIASFPETLDWVQSWSKQDLDGIKIGDGELSNSVFIKQAKVHIIESTKPEHIISRDLVRKSLSIPSTYFASRGYSQEILDKYDIGECISKDPRKEMFGRAVVPIYDENYSYLLGCSGRSIHPHCSSCYTYHIGDCPKEEYRWQYSKWRHSKTLRAERVLFNNWFAKPFIQKHQTVILVESPGNSLKIEESGIPFSVATLGTNLSEYNILALSGYGAMNIVVIGDNDLAGEDYVKSVKNKCSNQFNVLEVKMSGDDVGCMAAETVRAELSPILKKLKINLGE